MFISGKAASLEKFPTGCVGWGMRVEWRAAGSQREPFDLCLQQSNTQRNHCADSISECQKGLEVNRGGFDCWSQPNTIQTLSAVENGKKESESTKCKGSNWAKPLCCWFLLSAGIEPTADTTESQNLSVTKTGGIKEALQHHISNIRESGITLFWPKCPMEILPSTHGNSIRASFLLATTFKVIEPNH